MSKLSDFIDAINASEFSSLKSALMAAPPYSGGLRFPTLADQSYPPASIRRSFRSLFAPV
jgi:hypothetical protein